jgi:hypothetical protein
LAGCCGRVMHCAILDLQVVGNKLPYKMPSGIFVLCLCQVCSVFSNLILWIMLILVLIVCGISGQVYRCLQCLHGLLFAGRCSKWEENSEVVRVCCEEPTAHTKGMWCCHFVTYCTATGWCG